MKKKICIVTATRAEYGLLRPIIQKLSRVDEFEVKVVVTGAHLSPEFALTYKEIEKDEIEIAEKIEILLSADTPSAISKSMGLAMIGFGDYFAREMPDLLILLGDRYETLAIAAAAMNQGTPIAHLYGGEITQGAVDDCIRHAVTKLSYLHFTSTEEYRKRVIQLGEEPERVYNVGAIGIENILQEKLLTKNELEQRFNRKLDKPYAVVTFHPVTLEGEHVEEQCRALLAACDAYPNMKFIFTKANADAFGRIINQMLDEYAKKNKNALVFDSLGAKVYLSILKYAEVVIGNSSSGLIEAPSLGIPTVNIGNRQRGRLQASSVISCEADTEKIIKSINLALSSEWKEKVKKSTNPYGNGDTSEKIIKIITDFLFNKKIEMKKIFYDLEICQ